MLYTNARQKIAGMFSFISDNVQNRKEFYNDNRTK